VARGIQLRKMTRRTSRRQRHEAQWLHAASRDSEHERLPGITMTERHGGLRDVRFTEFARLTDAAYLNAASLGPLPKRTRLAMATYGESRAAVHTMGEADFTGPPAKAREAAARLISASSTEIALGPNTSFGINLAALGLQVPTGSTVLVSDGEFPAVVYPWMHRSRFRLELVPTTAEGWPDEERMLERVASGNVAVLAISSVQFHNGYRADLEALGRACRAAGTFFVVDAIQSLGHLPMNVAEVYADVLATGGHKWLCGPFGGGFAYVRHEIQERLLPEAIGWFSMRATRDLESVTSYELGFVYDASRYEVGTQPQQDLLGFAESVNLLLEMDVAAIWSWIDDLLHPLREWLHEHPEVTVLSSFEEPRRSGILSFRPPDAARVARNLKRAGVICSVREGGIRIAAHLYNTNQDIGRVLDVLDSGAAEGWR
jgi:cysteine desulfurase / selenocysteine lyase